MKDLIAQIVFYSIINSFVVFGVLKTIKKIADKEKLNRFIGLGVTYIVGIIMGFMIWSTIPIWEKIAYGFFIGCTSIAVYESATKSLLDIIPTIINAIFRNTGENK
jgi:divalent metal cation (Fe/Co/Zn/Cd) transporter